MVPINKEKLIQCQTQESRQFIFSCMSEYISHSRQINPYPCNLKTKHPHARKREEFNLQEVALAHIQHLLILWHLAIWDIFYENFPVLSHTGATTSVYCSSGERTVRVKLAQKLEDRWVHIPFQYLQIRVPDTWYSTWHICSSWGLMES